MTKVKNVVSFTSQPPFQRNGHVKAMNSRTPAFSEAAPDQLPAFLLASASSRSLVALCAAIAYRSSSVSAYFE
jgi:hypothetical protein